MDGLKTIKRKEKKKFLTLMFFHCQDLDQIYFNGGVKDKVSYEGSHIERVIRLKF